MREKLYRGPFRAIKVGFGAEKLQKLVEAIEKDMERIKNLTEGSYVEPVSEQNTCVGTLKKWRDAREHSRRLFNALNSKWGCGCTTAHRASLQLNWGNDQNDETQFEVLFSFEIPAASLPWNWRNVKIKLSQAPNVQYVDQLFLSLTYFADMSKTNNSSDQDDDDSGSCHCNNATIWTKKGVFRSPTKPR
jgi:hypothetical protein